MKYQSNDAHVNVRKAFHFPQSQHGTRWNKLQTCMKTDRQYLTALKILLSRLLSSGSLIIISPSVDDTATYECSVTNDAGEDKRTVDLTVQGRTILVCKLNIILMTSFVIPPSQEDFPFLVVNTYFCVERERLWKSVRVGNVYFALF